MQTALCQTGGRKEVKTCLAGSILSSEIIPLWYPVAIQLGSWHGRSSLAGALSGYLGLLLKLSKYITTLCAKGWPYREGALLTFLSLTIFPRRLFSSLETPFMTIQITGVCLSPGLFSTWLNITHPLWRLRLSFSCLGAWDPYRCLSGIFQSTFINPPPSNIRTVYTAYLSVYLSPQPNPATVDNVPLGNRENTSGLIQIIWWFGE